MLVVTTNDIPGWEIQRVCGEVFGLTVRSRNVFSQMGAGFKSMLGGELQGMTKNLIDSRNEVMRRMLESARQRGGNAVIAMRFDTSEMGDVWTEICAYGTAVVAIPVTEGARQTAAPYQPPARVGTEVCEKNIALCGESINEVASLRLFQIDRDLFGHPFHSAQLGLVRPMAVINGRLPGGAVVGHSAFADTPDLSL